jgi:hypothetical protein
MFVDHRPRVAHDARPALPLDRRRGHDRADRRDAPAARARWFIWFNIKSGRIDPEEIEHEIEIEMDETPEQSAERDASGLKA